ncbi:MAG: hypothetical protein DSM106950_23220 [Stigonema ocellatum SAG 48.90 = DSM 106950]|nr:hypothetical protein [Stigonema ocellatum SAG 48.90 = DSM 106950]
MSSASLNQFIAFPRFLLLAGWLVLISCCHPAQAKTISSNILVAQGVVEPLPPPPPISGVPNSEQSLPQLQPSSELPVIEFRQSQPSQVAPVPQYNRQYRRQNHRGYGQTFGRYLVYVNSDSPQLLQQVRQIEPNAYIRQFQGRSVIQAGAFSRQYNAQQRLTQLRSYGINRTEIVSNGERIPDSYREPTPYSYREPRPYSSGGDDYGRNRSKSYYVAIPANSEQLPGIESQIRQSVGINTGVTARNHPRGSHVAVGPFAQQLEAEQWNNYLKNNGFGNARVYYGR